VRALVTNFAAQPVVFLEYLQAEYVEVAQTSYRTQRLSRFDDAWAAQRRPGDEAPHTPYVMTDSGHRIAFGGGDFYASYGLMIETALDRPAELVIHARKYRPVGGSFVVEADVTNTSERTLAFAENQATLHVLMFEGHRVRDIAGEVDRMASRHVPIDPPLYPGQTRRFEVQLAGFRLELYPSKVEGVVFVDALASTEPRRWDMLQAALAGNESLPPTPTVAPTATFTPTPTATPPPTLTAEPSATPAPAPVFLPFAERIVDRTLSAVAPHRR
jgi:hypothetical protein